MAYERVHEPMAPMPVFLRRLLASLALAVVLIGVSLAAGMVGYHGFERESWLDAFADAAMILSGMGPLNPLHTEGGKIFAGFYALYSGLLFVATAGLILAPMLHRFLHHMHLADEDEAGDPEPENEANQRPGRRAV